MLIYLKVALILTFSGPSAQEAVELAPKNLQEEVKALIFIESRGNSFARSGRHVGILQMRQTYVRDVGGHPGHWAALPWRNDLAVELFVRANKKYRTLSSTCPQIAVAVLHKGGPGTLKSFNTALKSGMDWQKSIDYASKTNKIPRLGEFVRRFRAKLRRKRGCLRV